MSWTTGAEMHVTISRIVAASSRKVPMWWKKPMVKSRGSQSCGSYYGLAWVSAVVCTDRWLVNGWECDLTFGAGEHDWI